MHGLESGAIVKLFTPLLKKSNNACENAILFLDGRQPVSGDQILVNTPEGFALIYRLILPV